MECSTSKDPILLNLGQFISGKSELHTPCLPTVFDLITALCAYVFQNYWEHSDVIKYVPIPIKDIL